MNLKEARQLNIIKWNDNHWIVEDSGWNTIFTRIAFPEYTDGAFEIEKGHWVELSHGQYIDGEAEHWTPDRWADDDIEGIWEAYVQQGADGFSRHWWRDYNDIEVEYEILTETLEEIEDTGEIKLEIYDKEFTIKIQHSKKDDNWHADLIVDEDDNLCSFEMAEIEDGIVDKFMINLGRFDQLLGE